MNERKKKLYKALAFQTLAQHRIHLRYNFAQVSVGLNASAEVHIEIEPNKMTPLEWVIIMKDSGAYGME